MASGSPSRLHNLHVTGSHKSFNSIHFRQLWQCTATNLGFQEDGQALPYVLKNVSAPSAGQFTIHSATIVQEHI